MKGLYCIMKKRVIFFILLLLIGILFLFNVSALIASPDSSYDLTIQSCVLESNSGTKNTYNTACTGAYPSSCSNGNNLSCDDNRDENTTYAQNNFAGVYIQVNNESINNCGSIGDVFLCYKWKRTSGGTSTNCMVAVDANGNASWTNVSTACPGTSEPASATCVNVTSNESWTCNNFFGPSGTKAAARDEISKSSGGPAETLSTDVLFFNVSWYLETTKPSGINLTNPTNQTINASGNWLFFSNASDNVQLANATLYTNISGSWMVNQTVDLTGTTNITNFTVYNIAPGGYSWNVEWCDSSNNCAQGSVNQTFIVNFAPNATLNNPPDNTSNVSDNHQFNGNYSDDRGLANASLYHNLSGSWTRNQTLDLSGTSNFTSFDIANITSGIYIWNIEVCDTENICSQAPANFTFTVNSTSSGGGSGSGSGSTSTSSSTPSGGIDSGERSRKLAGAQAARISSAPASNPAPSAPAPSSAAAVTGAAASLPTGNVVKEEGTKPKIENKRIANTIIWSIIGLILILGAYAYEQITKRKALKGRIRKWLNGIRIRTK